MSTLSLNFDEPVGRTLRDSGIASVMDHSGEWKDLAFEAVCTLPAGWQGLGEDVTAFVRAKVGDPHHPGAWGGLTQKAIRRGVLVRTKEYRQSQSPGNHAHEYRVLLRI